MKAIKDGLKNLLPDVVFSILIHIKRHKELPNLFSPHKLNEKILYRKLFDRRELLTQLADKHGARCFVEKRIGAHILPQLYHITSDPADIPFADLPDKFVIKPTHGAGWVKLVKDKSRVTKEELITLCQSWLGMSYYKMTREHVYRNIRPQILIEEYIEDGSGIAPIDYKLFVFDGEVRFIQVDKGRFESHGRSFFTPGWHKLDVRMGLKNIPGKLPRPANLDMMIRAAEKIGKDMDFIRVDFYDTNDRIYFGEITTTHANGLEVFLPKKYDSIFGAYWDMQPLSQPGTRLRCSVALPVNSSAYSTIAS